MLLTGPNVHLLLDPTLSCKQKNKASSQPFSSASLFRTLGYRAHQHTSRYLYFPSQQIIPLNLISPFSITSFTSLLQQQTSSCLGEVKVTQSYPTLCDPMNYSLPGSLVHGIFQAWVLEWVAISFSSRSSQPRDRTRVSLKAGTLLSELPGKPLFSSNPTSNPSSSLSSTAKIYHESLIR